MTEPTPMPRVADQLERLDHALDRVEAALADREARMSAEIDALRRAAAEAGDVDVEAVRAVAGRVDRAIERLESVLGS